MLFPCVKQFALTESLSTQEYKGGSSKLSGTPDEILVGGGGRGGGVSSGWMSYLPQVQTEFFFSFFTSFCSPVRG